MSDQHEINRAHEARFAELEQQEINREARIAELERQLAAQTGQRLLRPRVSRTVVTVGLALALLLPGIALASHRFSDVPDSNPFHNDIDWVAQYGITTGFGDGTYRPGQAVTRQAMAAFMHRLSNQFEVVQQSAYPGESSTFYGYAPCPGDKRAIAGGSITTSTNLFITDSYPSGSTWTVRWESDNNTLVDPGSITVYALCAPRL
ncbi:MAG: S-layer homology domain-containing protein [Candidatus Limnocylindrales bacterium]